MRLSDLSLSPAQPGWDPLSESAEAGSKLCRRRMCFVRRWSFFARKHRLYRFALLSSEILGDLASGGEKQRPESAREPLSSDIRCDRGLSSHHFGGDVVSGLQEILCPEKRFGDK